MNCRAWEDLLQRRLDGGPPEELSRHLLDCPHCAAHRADLTRLLDGMARLTPPRPPAALAGRLTAAVLGEARARRRARRRTRAAVFAGLAAAAALLLAVGLSTWPRPEKARPLENGTPHVQAVEPPAPPPLRDNVAVAGDAVASLTKGAARNASDQSAALLSSMKDAAEPLTLAPGPVEPQLDRPMREAADSVSNGLTPVTGSARRAVGLFMRDLPVGKSDNKTAAKTE